MSDGTTSFLVEITVAENSDISEASEDEEEEEDEDASTASDSDENENDDNLIHIGTLKAGSSVIQGEEEEVSEDEDAEDDADDADEEEEEDSSESPISWGATLVQIPTGADPLLDSDDSDFDSGESDNGDQYTVTLGADCPDCASAYTPFSVLIELTVLSDDEWRDDEVMNAYLAYNQVTWNQWKKVSYSESWFDEYSDLEDEARLCPEAAGGQIACTLVDDEPYFGEEGAQLVDAGTFIMVEFLHDKPTGSIKVTHVSDDDQEENTENEDWFYLELYGTLANAEPTEAEPELWASVAAMQAWTEYGQSSCTWEEMAVVDDEDTDASEFDATADSYHFIKISEVASDGECELTGDGVDNNQVHVVGYVGPWTEDEDPEASDAEYNCGVLLRVDAVVSSDDEIDVTFGDGEDESLDIVITVDSSTVETAEACLDGRLRLNGLYHSVVMLKVPDDAATDHKYTYEFQVEEDDGTTGDKITLEVVVAPGLDLLATLMEIIIPLGGFVGLTFVFLFL